MVVQCEACQTRFRLADEKIKAGGTKVRCSKCKQIFTVTPPEPEPESAPEPAATEETVDFGSFNMEAVAAEGQFEQTEESSAERTETTASPQEELALGASSTNEVSEPENNDIDFSTLEEEMGDGEKLATELADDFSFADTSQPIADDGDSDEMSASSDKSLPFNEPSAVDNAELGQFDFGGAFEDSEGPAEPTEFAFGEKNETTEPSITSAEGNVFSADESSFETNDFTLDKEPVQPHEQDSPSEFSFGDESEDNTFGFDNQEEVTATEETGATAFEMEEATGPSEFSFDEDDSFGEVESNSEWGDESSGTEDSFDFEEPQFDTTDAPAENSSGKEGLQFGEIDFSGDGEETGSSNFGSDGDFSQAKMQREETPEEDLSLQQRSEPAPARDYDDEPLPAPPPQKSKGPLSSILTLLALLLVILGGAAGYLYMQNGSINLHQVAEYLPFLQEYIGAPPASEQAPRIGIKISGSSYVNGKEGQLLVIQGEAVNNYSISRSAITVKGVLLDPQGQTLLQQTVSSGNYIDEETLKIMPFTEIEEAMNNQFGAGLSNMNVAAGVAIPFTIVFRNIPAEIASINVEVVDSIPGG